MDRLLAARAAGQAGLVTRAQALDRGMTRRSIGWRLERGSWVRVHPGVYLTTPGRTDWEMQAVAALLHAGPGAALCRRSAARAWTMTDRDTTQIEVVIPAERRVRPVEGVTIRRSRHALDRVHPTEWPHRIVAEHTALDLAMGESFDTAVGWVAKALTLSSVSPLSLAEALQARPRQTWRSELLEAFEDVAHGCESAAELRFLRDVERAHGLPPSRRQVVASLGVASPSGSARKNAVAGVRRDVEFSDYDVVVEIDGRLGHDGWAARQREGRRDRKAATTGRLTVRCHWPDLVPTGCELAGDLSAILRSRGWTGSAHPCGQGCGLATWRRAS